MRCNFQDAEGAIGIILRAVPCRKSVFADGLPASYLSQLLPQHPGSYPYLILSGDFVRDTVLRPNRLLGSAGQFLREAEGGDEPGIEKKRHPGDAYV